MGGKVPWLRRRPVESRTEDGIRLTLQEKRNHAKKLLRMVFEVGILADGEVGVRKGQPCSQGFALAVVPWVAHKLPDKFFSPILPFQGLLKPMEDGRGLIAGTVVHHDHPDRTQQRAVSQDSQTGETGVDQRLFIVNGDNDRECGGRSHDAGRILKRRRSQGNA